MRASTKTASAWAIAGSRETGTRLADLIGGDHLLGQLESLGELDLRESMGFAQLEVALDADVAGAAGWMRPALPSAWRWTCR